MFPFKAQGKVVGVVPTRDNSGVYVKVECRVPPSFQMARDCQETSLDVLFPINMASQVPYGAQVEIDGDFFCYDKRKRKNDNSGDMLFTNYVFQGKTCKVLKPVAA